MRDFEGGKRFFWRNGIWLFAVAFSFVVMAAVMSSHVGHVATLPKYKDDSGAGVVLILSYILLWPGTATALLILFDGMYMERNFSRPLILRSVFGGILPVAMSICLLKLGGVVPRPGSNLVILLALVGYVAVPILIAVLGINSCWPFSHRFLASPRKRQRLTRDSAARSRSENEEQEGAAPAADR